MVRIQTKMFTLWIRKKGEKCKNWEVPYFEEMSNLYTYIKCLCLYFLFVLNYRHGMSSWKDQQSPGLKLVCGNMGLQACFHQLGRIWEHTGEGSLKCNILFLKKCLKWNAYLCMMLIFIGLVLERKTSNHTNMNNKK